MTPFHIRRKTFFCFLFLLAFWLSGFGWFLAQIPNKKSDFSENSADAIVVLTGGAGRLEYGLKLLQENKAQIMFISGVGDNVKLGELYRNSRISKKLAEKISLGHIARNTIGNAEETADWLSDKNYKKILLVTSDYHIPRSSLEFAEILPNITIIPAPVLVDDKTADEKGLTISEYNKYLASKLRHLFVSVMEKK
jgi:uncharacterized SAM-binding protein YcdF (DUF218 family)